MVPTTEMRSHPPHPPTQTPHTSCTIDLQVKSQSEDGPHIGPKHVVVFLLYH